MPALRLIALVALVLLAGCAAGSPHDAGATADPRALTIAIEARDMPPLHEANEDGFAGFEPDLLNALCDAMAVRCQFVSVPFHRILPGLINGRFDAALPLERTEERAKVVDFTEPYLRVPYTFLKRKGSDVTATPQGLNGKTIGVHRLCPEADQLGKNANAAAYVTGRFAGVKTRAYDMLAHCGTGESASAETFRDWLPAQLRDLDSGAIDAIFGNKFALHDAVIMAPGGRRYEFTDATFFDFIPGMSIAVGRSKPGLLRDLNAALATIQQNGTYRNIRTRYFPFDISGQS